MVINPEGCRGNNLHAISLELGMHGKYLLRLKLAESFLLKLTEIPIPDTFIRGNMNSHNQWHGLMRSKTLSTQLIPYHITVQIFPWSPLFEGMQRYRLGYIHAVEGKSEVMFALADDGNLWVWNHEIAGLTGMIFFTQ